MAWLALRQAQEALRTGRLEEAQRLLAQSVVQGHRRSWELQQQVAQALVERGERHLRRDDPEVAWQDLVCAEKLGVAVAGAERLRQSLSKLGLTEVRALLESGDPVRAAEKVAVLRQYSVRLPELQVLEDAAHQWVQANELAARGEFGVAGQLLEKVRRHLAGLDGPLRKLQADFAQRRTVLGPLVLQLHEAVKEGSWRQVIEVSEQVLGLAPQHVEARKARAQAWKAVEPITVAAVPRMDRPAPGPDVSPRFLLWIDGVGGYLVCLGNRVTIGQATPEIAVDVPLFAEVSRLHATVTRDSEGYLLEAVRSVQVNGQAADRALLQDNDRLTVGSACQMTFRQPVPVSATARLDVVSGHRLPWAVDGVILMADTLVLGRGGQVHIELPEVQQQVVLFRQKEGLGIRCQGTFTIDGQRCQDRGTLGEAATVTGEDFAFAVEPIGNRR